MKFLKFVSTLLTASAVTVFSQNCDEDLKKYNDCISAVDPNTLKSNSLFDIDKNCKILKGNECADFMKDVYSSSINCDINDKDEKDAALSIINLKINYLKYCVVDDEGSACPLSHYLIENISDNKANDGKNTDTPKEEDKKEEKVPDTDNYQYVKDNIEDRGLEDWDGKWFSVYPIIKEGGLDETAEIISKKQGGKVTPEQLIEQFVAGTKSDIYNITISGKDNTMTYDYENGKSVKSEYKFVGKEIIEWEPNVFWGYYKFKSVDEKSGAPIYIYLCDDYLKPTTEGNRLHIWISNKSFEDALDKTRWMVFYEDGTDIKTISDSFVEEFGGEEEGNTETPMEEDKKGEDKKEENKKEENKKEENKKEENKKEEIPDSGNYQYVKDNIEDRSLEDWDGKWFSVYPIIKEGGLDETAEIISKKRGGKVTPEQLIEQFVAGTKSDIYDITISGKDNTMTYDYENGKSVKSEYKFVGKEIIEWEPNVFWGYYKFKSVDEKSGAPIYIYLCDDYLKPTTEGNRLHIWISNKSFEDALDKTRWMVFYEDGTDIKTISDSFVEEFGGEEEGNTETPMEEDKKGEDKKEENKKEENKKEENKKEENKKEEIPDSGNYQYVKDNIEDRSLEDWDGKWFSVYPIIKEGGLDETAEIISKKRGGKVTPEQLIEQFVAGTKSDIYDITISGKDNTMTYDYENGKSVKSEYKFVGKEIIEWEPNVFWGYYKFKSVDEKSGAPIYIYLCDDYLKPTTEGNRLHIWISNKSFEDALDKTRWMVFYEDGTDIKTISDSFVEEFGGEEEGNTETPMEEDKKGEDKKEENKKEENKKEENKKEEIPDSGNYQYVKDNIEDRSLEDWDGKWFSVYPIIKEGGLDETAEIISKKRGGKVTPEQLIEQFVAGTKSDIYNITISGKDNTMTYDYENGKSVKSEYKFVGKEIIEWDPNVFWGYYKFKAIDEKSGAPIYIYLCDDYLKPTTEGNRLHIWISNKSFEDALDKTRWMVFYEDGTDIKTISDSFVEEFGEEEENADATKKVTKREEEILDSGNYQYVKENIEDRSLEDWDGKWFSVYPIIKEGGLDETAEIISKKQGGKVTPEQLIEQFVAGTKSDIYNITISGKDNTMTYDYENGKSVKSEYKFVGKEIIEWDPNVFWGYYKFKAVDEKSGAPIYIYLCDDYLKPTTEGNRLHIWISYKSFEDALDKTRWMVFYEDGTDIKTISDSFVEEFGEEEEGNIETPKEEDKKGEDKKEENKKEENKKEENKKEEIPDSGNYQYVKDNIEDRSLEDWDGKWFSVYPIIKEGGLDETAEIISKKQGGKVTPEQLIEQFVAGTKSDIYNITISGKDNTMTYDYENGKSVKSEYKFVGKEIIEWEPNVFWGYYKFKSVDEKSGAPIYIYLCDDYLKPTTEGNRLHIWISNKSFEDALDKTRWMVFYEDGTDIKTISDSFVEEFGEEEEGSTETPKEDDKKGEDKKEEIKKEEIPDNGNYQYVKDNIEDRSLEDWDGKWFSVYPIIKEGGLDETAKIISKKQGGKVTPEQLIEQFVAGTKSDIYNITISGKDNTITYDYENGKSVKSEYKFVGKEIIEWEPNVFWGYYKFKSVDEKSGAPIYIYLCDDYLKPTTEGNRLHIWISNKSFEDALDKTRWMVFYEDGTDIKTISDSFVEEFGGEEEGNTDASKDIIKDDQESSEEESIDVEETIKEDQEDSEEESTDSTKKPTKEKSKEKFKDTSKKETKENLKEKSNDATKEIIKEDQENSKEESTDTSKKSFKEDSKEKFTDTNKKTTKENSKEKSTDIAKEPTKDTQENSEEDIVESSDEEDDNIDNIIEAGNTKNEEKKELLMKELYDDCQIDECNKRFLTLVELMKLSDPISEETKLLESASEYYKTKNCEGIQDLAKQYSSDAPSSLRKMSFTLMIITFFIFTLLF